MVACHAHSHAPNNARETPLLESTPPRPGKQLSPLNPCALDFSLRGTPSDVDDSEDIRSLRQPVFNLSLLNLEMKASARTELQRPKKATRP
jgi:hypothetical protein